jgi:hypothetical protein
MQSECMLQICWSNHGERNIEKWRFVLCITDVLFYYCKASNFMVARPFFWKGSSCSDFQGSLPCSQSITLYPEHVESSAHHHSLFHSLDCTEQLIRAIHASCNMLAFILRIS